ATLHGLQSAVASEAGLSFQSAGEVLVTARQPLARTSLTSASVRQRPPAIRGIFRSEKSLATLAATAAGRISTASGRDFFTTETPRSTARLSDKNSRTTESNPSRRAAG